MSPDDQGRAGEFPEDYGSIVVRERAVEVLEAPDFALVSLRLIQQSDQRSVYVDGDELSFGSVLYEVIGWDKARQALQVKKVRDGF